MTASKARKKNTSTLEVGDLRVRPGRMKKGELPIARLFTENYLSLPVAVVNGAYTGPAIWLTAAIHGEELNGVEIVRRVLAELDPKMLCGALIAVPVVNVFGFITESRYLPDRRDLNRSFPGSARGSLASRMAHLLMREIVGRCGYGIDLHTGSDHRTNLPQVRADLDDPETRDCALAFGAPVVIHARTRDGSLREAAVRKGARVLVFEAGETHRFEPAAIEAGTRGCLNVMAHLGMIEPRDDEADPPVEVRKTKWVRAGRSGILHLEVGVGDAVAKKQRLGFIADTFGDRKSVIRSPITGLVIARGQSPLVHQGEAVLHIAETGPGAGADAR